MQCLDKSEKKKSGDLGFRLGLISFGLLTFMVKSGWVRIIFKSSPIFRIESALKGQKKFGEQQNTKQEAVFGSRPSSARPSGPKKVVGPRANGGANGTPNRRLSLNTNQNDSKSAAKNERRDSVKLAGLARCIAISKEDVASHVFETDTSPASP
ncbi:hypothetical protein V6N13_074675 [Hibiscus sabdariffa]